MEFADFTVFSELFEADCVVEDGCDNIADALDAAVGATEGAAAVEEVEATEE